VKVTLETSRLILRPFESGDVEAAFGWFGDPIVMRFTPSGPDTSIDQTKARLANYQTHQNAHGFSKWIILEQQLGRAIGDSGLLKLNVAGYLVRMLGRRATAQQECRFPRGRCTRKNCLREVAGGTPAWAAGALPRSTNLLKAMHSFTICENRATDFPVAPGPIFNADVDKVGAPMRRFRRSVRQLSFI